MKSISIDTDALVMMMMMMMMIFSPVCGRGRHLKGARVREVVVTKKIEQKLKTKTNKH